MANVFLYVVFLKPTEVKGKKLSQYVTQKTGLQSFLTRLMQREYPFKQPFLILQSLFCMLIQSLEDNMAFNYILLSFHNFNASLEPQER